MGKFLKYLWIIFVAIIVGIVVWSAVYYNKEDSQPSVIENENNSIETSSMNAVIMRANGTSLLVMEADRTNSLISLTAPEDIGFKQGQEIIIYWDGIVFTTYPAQIYNIGKIEIIKEKSDVEITDRVLKYCYNSHDNFKVDISELTSEGILLVITDTNKYPYEFSHDYIINKKVKNQEYTGIGKYTEATSTTTSSYTRNRFRIYLGRT